MSKAIELYNQVRKSTTDEKIRIELWEDFVDLPTDLFVTKWYAYLNKEEDDVLTRFGQLPFLPDSDGTDFLEWDGAE